MSAFSLEGRNVLITGAAGGIGSETARVCAELGATLVLADIEEPRELAAELRERGATVSTYAFDVADRGANERMVAEQSRVDAVVANAGTLSWEDWEEDHWDQAFERITDVNVLGVIHLARACLPRMYRQGGGNMVIVSSVAARMGGLRAGPHYVASKGGVHALAKWLARRAAPHGVAVNSVAPGATVTPMTEGRGYEASSIPMQRLAAPREIALPIAFLCSDAASYMCGATLDVNGGVYMG